MNWKLATKQQLLDVANTEVLVGLQLLKRLGRDIPRSSTSYLYVSSNAAHCFRQATHFFNLAESYSVNNILEEKLRISSDLLDNLDSIQNTLTLVRQATKMANDLHFSERMQLHRENPSGDDKLEEAFHLFCKAERLIVGLRYTLQQSLETQ
jgi:hypothetical protein